MTNPLIEKYNAIGRNDNDIMILTSSSADHRHSSRWTTRFEKARLKGTRSEQCARGSLPIVPYPQSFGVADIPLTMANLEYDQRCLPLQVQRVTPSHREESWTLSQMIINKPQPLQLQPNSDLKARQMDPYAPISIEDASPTKDDEMQQYNGMLSAGNDINRRFFFLSYYTKLAQ
jgi:DNA-directed RNA polymerase subunit K/omega